MIKHISLFSGIESFKKAMTNLGIENELVGYSEIDKYASTALSAVHGVSEGLNFGDITKIDETDLPDSDLITYSFPCVTGDTLVLTEKDGHKKIVNIKVGDKVLSHDNKYNEVTKVLNQGIKEIWNTSAMGSHEVKTTGDHLFYTRLRYKEWDNERRMGVRKFKEPEWVKCENLTKNHYVGYAINTNSTVLEWEPVLPNNPPLPLHDPRFWYLAGRYVGDGWVKVGHDRNSNISGAVICCGKHKVEEFKKNIGDLFHYTIAEERTTYKLHFSNKELGTFLSLFGRGAKNKQVPSEVIDLPIELLQHFLDGYWDSDGSEKNGLYRATSVSEKLVYGMGQCIAKVYKRPFSIYKSEMPPTCVIEGRTVNQSDLYQINFKKEISKQDNAFYEDGHIWAPINKVTNTGEFENVYDITVKDAHSFTANGHIVHNCQDLSVAGLGKGMGEGTRSGLVLEALRIIKYKKPKYAIMENVKNLVSKKFRKDFDGLLAELEEFGYNNYWKVLNAKDFGIPQNRERVFVISIRKDIDDGKFEFPEGFDSGLRLKDLLLDEVEDKYYINNEKVTKLISQLEEKNLLTGERFCADSTINDPSKRVISNCLTARYDAGIQNQKQIGLVVAEPIIVASRGRNPVDSSDRTTRKSTEQRLEPNKQGTTNTLTSVQKDNLLLEPKIVQKVGDRVTSNYSIKEISNTIPANPMSDRGQLLLEPNELLLHTNLSGGKWDKIHESARRVYKEGGIAPTIPTCGGGNVEPKVAIEEPKTSKELGYVDKKCANFIEEKGYFPEMFNPYNEVEIKGTAPTQTTQCGSSSSSATVLVKQATKKGYIECELGGVADLSYPDSKLRRGRVQGGGNICPTIIAGEPAVHRIETTYKIRKLTPNECWRLMGYTDEDYFNARKALEDKYYNGKDRSNSQMYKIAGNSIVVDVLENILKNLFKKD